MFDVKAALVEALRKGNDYAQLKADENGGLFCLNDLADYLLADGWIKSFCKAGDTVYQRLEFSGCAKVEDCECDSCEGCAEEEEVIYTNICPVPVTEGTYYEINRLFGEVYFSTKEQAIAYKTGPQYKFFEGELSK